MNPDTTALQQVVLYLAGGGGAIAVAYWLFENVSQLAGLAPKTKRIASLAVAAIVAMLAYAAAVGLTYVDAPLNSQSWVEALFAVAFLATAGSQALHGLRKL